MLELLIAIFVILTALLAGLYTISGTLAATSVYKHQLIAAYLAQEGIELVRYIRDTNLIQGLLWTEGKLDKCSEYCEAEHDPGNLTECNPNTTPPSCSGEPRFLKISTVSPKFYNYSSGTNTIFKRKITIKGEDLDPAEDGPEALEVTAEVIWQEKGKNYSFVVQEKIYKWK